MEVVLSVQQVVHERLDAPRVAGTNIPAICCENWDTIGTREEWAEEVEVATGSK